MKSYVSYCELALEDGKLRARFGSGPAEDIVGRSQTDPSLRICIREPADDSVEFRMRCGIAEMTPMGLVPQFLDDPTERRGAWIGLLSIAIQVWPLLREAFECTNSIQAIKSGIASGWLEVDENIFRAVESVTATQALTGSVADTKVHVFVRLGGAPGLVTQALELLRDALEDARCEMSEGQRGRTSEVKAAASREERNQRQGG